MKEKILSHALFLLFPLLLLPETAVAEGRSEDGAPEEAATVSGTRTEKRSPARKSSCIGIMFWNVENFFDYTDGGRGKSDADFSSKGEKQWTQSRFNAKCSAVSKTVFRCADSLGGRMPDIVAFAEVENRWVVERIAYGTQLYKFPYRVVHFDSPDPRGIDCALIYRSDRLKLDSAKPCHLGFNTRDILLAQFVTRDGDSLAVTVNHHSSKLSKGSETRRARCVDKLMAIGDSLSGEGWRTLVCVGDFNEEPTDTLYRRMDALYDNLSLPLALQGLGTIRFSSRWQLIDQAIVSKGLDAGMRICDFDFLTQTASGSHAGTKPLRTYSGKRYLGGVSDHYPILLEIRFDRTRDARHGTAGHKAQ